LAPWRCIIAAHSHGGRKRIVELLDRLLTHVHQVFEILSWIVGRRGPVHTNLHNQQVVLSETPVIDLRCQFHNLNLQPKFRGPHHSVSRCERIPPPFLIHLQLASATDDEIGVAG
jgi:hypothetical protein